MGNRLRGLVSRPPENATTTEGLVVSQQIDTGVLFDPTSNGWDIVQRGFDCNVWRNMNTGEQVQEYRLVANDQIQFLDCQRSFKLRFKSQTLVSSLFFKDETQSQLCTKYYKGNLYLQRIPLRLSDIDQIPYPDVLHIYSQCFKGYAELHQAMGFFDISQQMICINSSGVVKVWLNKNLDKYLPPVYYHNGNQREMVLKVVRIISQNTNQTTLPDRISDWIIRADPYTFRDAFGSLQGFASRYNTQIPEALNCVINFMKLKYVQEQEVYEGAPMDFDFDLPPPQVDVAGLNQMISENLVPIFQQPPQQYLPPPVVPPITTTVISQQRHRQYQTNIQNPIHIQPQVQTKRRRILQHKDHPVLYSNFIRDPASGRIPMSSIVTGPTQSILENRITFGQQPIQSSQSNVYSSQNPFKSVLQKLKISNHYQPKIAPVPVTQTVYIPERDYISNTNNTYDNNPYISSHKQTTTYSYQPRLITSGGGMVTNSLAGNSSPSKYPTYGNYGLYDGLEEGKTSQEILNYIRKFKSSQQVSPYQYQSNITSKYQSIPPYKYETTPPIVSQTSSGAVYRDIGDTSHLVDSYRNKFSDSISVDNRVEIIEQTIIQKKSIYRQEVSRPKERSQLVNIDQEIQRDLKKLRSSKASKNSRTQQYRMMS